MTPPLDRYLEIRSASTPVWTADGRTIVLRSDLTGLPQAYAVRAEGAWPLLLTVGSERVVDLLASPTDPGTVVFTRDVGGDERLQVWCTSTDGLGERRLSADDEAIHRLGAFTPDGRTVLCCANGRNGVDFDLVALPLDGEPRTVAQLAGWNDVQRVTPDGRHAVVVASTGLLESRVLLVELDSGVVSELAAGPDPTFFDTGGIGPRSRLFLRTDLGGDRTRAGAIDLAGAADAPLVPRLFGPEGMDVDEVAVRASTGVLVANDGGRSRLLVFDPLDLQVTRELTIPLGVVSGAELDHAGRRLAFTLSAPSLGTDVWVADLAGGGLRRLTRSTTAGVDPSTFVEPELVRIRSFDGLDIPAWVYRPPAVARPAAVVWIHGGPESQARAGFEAVHQLVVAAGFALVMPNVRGSTGYGRRYTALDDRELRLDAVADIEAVGRWVDAQPDLAERKAVVGRSYGGYMVLMALAHQPEAWDVGVEVVGMVDLVTFLERTGDYRRALREREYGTLEHDRELLRRLSPITRIDAIRAPLLVIHGRNDPRVPVGEAEQVTARLRELGRDVELIVLDDEGHGISRLANQRTAYGRMVAFLDTHVRA